MKPLSLARVRHAVIVAPHADDETIGAYGLIRALRARAARVRVLVVTDGAGSHPNSIRWPRARLVAERRRETRAAMRRLGVPAGGVAFLDLPDGGLSSADRGQREAIRRAVGRARDCDLLVLPARDDDHPDHRMVASAIGLRGMRQVEYLVWPNRQTGSRPASHRLLLGIGAAAKRGAIRRYRTQVGVIQDDPAGFAMSRAELARFAWPTELYRQVRR